MDLVLNMLLIPQYASIGAAIGTLVAEFAVLLVQMGALKDSLGKLLQSIHYGKFTVALILGTIGSIWVRQLQQEAFVTLVIYAICYFSIYFASLLKSYYLP